MKKLYVIGNGFDIAHGLPTKYWDFRLYLEANHPFFLREFEKMYDYEPFDALDSYSAEDQRNWLNNIKEKFWNVLEYEMGYPAITSMECFASDLLASMDLDPENTGIRDTMDDYWEHEYGFIEKLQTYIEEWISSIDLSGVVPRKRELIKNSEDLFLNFNYTRTLEMAYGIRNVLHIHGSVGEIGCSSPIMGHGNKDEMMERKRLIDEAENIRDESEASIQSAILIYLERTFKNTASIIEENSYFFKDLSDVEHIVILGWSIGRSDVPYLQKIVSSGLPFKKWTVYYYRPEDLDSIRGTLVRNIPQGIYENSEIEFLPSDSYWDK